ncbi:MAG: hypothetical protein ABW075_03120 [Aeromicrobium sp.]
MSGYTVGEIVVWLLIAATLGFVLGWLCRELVVRRRTRSGPPVASPPAAPVARPTPAPAPEPDPAPIRPAAEPTPTGEVSVEPGPHPGSVLPLDGGESPAPQFVVKVSRGSKIYHAPSSPAYGRTTAALWFESPEAAEAAGFRKPKNA